MTGRDSTPAGAPGGVPERLTVAEIRTRRGRWTAGQLRALPATVDLETAASVLAMGLTKARELARAGAFPVRVIRHGDRYVVPSRALLALLDVEAERPAA